MAKRNSIIKIMCIIGPNLSGICYMESIDGIFNSC